MPDAIIPSSGTQNFNPSAGDIVLDAFGRIQLHPPALTANHWNHARLSAGFLQIDISNQGFPLLWKEKLLQVPLQPGVSFYQLPRNVVACLDAYIRVYQTGNAQNFAPSFRTSFGSQTVSVNQPLHGYWNGTMVWYPIPISIGGIIIQGPQFVSSIVDQDNYEIIVPQMPGTALPGGAVPIITSIAGSSVLNVNLPANGMSAGQFFYFNVPVTVGGVLLAGGFRVLGWSDPNNFTVQGPQTANSSQTLPMNAGLAQAQTQQFGGDPFDYILYPISRSEYAAQPDKGTNYGLEFRPTTFRFIRTVQPAIQFWVPPDNANPYVFFLYVIAQPDDVVIPGGVGVDIPWRFGDAFSAGLAAKLAVKFPPPVASGITVQMLRMDYDAWPDGALWRALREDIERVPFHISCGLDSYFR